MNSTTSKPVVNVDGDTVTIKIHSPAPTAFDDRLVHRGNCGLEARAFDELAVPKKKIGRRVYARMSDILALIDAKPVETPVDATDDLQVALDRKARRASR